MTPGFTGKSVRDGGPLNLTPMLNLHTLTIKKSYKEEEGWSKIPKISLTYFMDDPIVHFSPVFFSIC